MDTEPALEPAASGDLVQIRRLLDDNGLPSADLGEDLAGFLVARVDGALAGVVGVESHGAAALLRSLCVAPSRRGRGLARALCTSAEAVARGLGARELYLLTTDARGYFEKRGFAVRPREEVAPAIRGTTQFATLCPSTADVMWKLL